MDVRIRPIELLQEMLRYSCIRPIELEYNDLGIWVRMSKYEDLGIWAILTGCLLGCYNTRWESMLIGCYNTMILVFELYS